MHFFADNEKKATWNEVFRFLKKCYPEIDASGVVYITDQDKGAKAVLRSHGEGGTVVFDNLRNFYCMFHFLANVRNKFSEDTKRNVEACIEARTEKDFDNQWSKLPEKVKNYVLSNGRDWTNTMMVHCPGLCGHRTSQGAESSNKDLKDQRCVPVCDLKVLVLICTLTGQ